MKKMKKFVAMAAAAAMAVTPMAAFAEDAEPYRVCFVARASADTFAAWLTTEMQEAAAQYDDIELTCVSGEADDNQMASLLEDCITKEYDLVIVQSNDNAAQAPYVKQIADAGIPVITTNPTTHQSDLDGVTGDEEVDNAVLEGTGTVDADPVEQASRGAMRAVEEVPENGNVVVLRGPSGNYHAEKRREAWDTYFFSERPDVTILYEDYANWNSDEAMTLMETWTQGGTHIDAIISMNDNMAAGAIEAVRNNSNPNYGFNAANEEYCDMIASGIIDPTKVSRSALENAASVSAMVLTTESLVANIPEPTPAAPAAPDMGY